MLKQTKALEIKTLALYISMLLFALKTWFTWKTLFSLPFLLFKKEQPKVDISLLD